MSIDTINKNVRFLICRLFMRYYSIGHKISKKIVFSSFSGLQYSDNPRAISEKLHELYPDYKICWIIDKTKDKYEILPEYIECIPPRGLDKFKAITTAACYVYNGALEPNIIKRNNQFFVQTWHGDRGFKKILYNAWKTKKRPFPIMDAMYTDVALSGSAFGTEVYRNAFNYFGEVMEVGCPRNDRLLGKANNRYILLIKQSLGIEEEKKVLLYAPTFRDHEKGLQQIKIDISQTIKALTEKTKRDWVCLVRSHHCANGLDIAGNEYIIDVSDYPDMADLLYISDFFITDYSSSIFDFYLTGRPSICATFDEQEYERNSRSFIVRPEESGIVVAKTQEELEHIIKAYSLDDYKKAYDAVDLFFHTKETGMAADAIVNRINDYIENSRM